jgi:hypothetical protein
MSEESYVKNSFIVGRDGDPYVFKERISEGIVLARLDRYAVVPLERYFDLSVQDNVRQLLAEDAVKSKAD